MTLRKLGELNALQRKNLDVMARLDLAAGKSVGMVAARLNVEEQVISDIAKDMVDDV